MKGMLICALLSVGFIVYQVLVATGCSASQKSNESSVATLTNTACQILDTQTEPDWIHMICAVEEAANPGVTKLIEMRVARVHSLDAGKDAK